MESNGLKREILAPILKREAGFGDAVRVERAIKMNRREQLDVRMGRVDLSIDDPAVRYANIAVSRQTERVAQDLPIAHTICKIGKMDRIVAISNAGNGFRNISYPQTGISGAAGFTCFYMYRLFFEAFHDFIALYQDRSYFKINRRYLIIFYVGHHGHIFFVRHQTKARRRVDRVRHGLSRAAGGLDVNDDFLIDVEAR